MTGPRGTGTLYQLEIQRLLGNIFPDDIIPVVDIFARPELWGLHQGTLWSVPNAGGVGAAAGRSSAGVGLPLTTTRMIAVVERIRIGGVAAEARLFVCVGAISGTLFGAFHRDIRRAQSATTPGTGVASRGSTQNTVTGAPGSVVDVIGHPANQTVDFPMDYVLEPGSMLFVAAIADATAITSDVTFIGRERSALEEELQV